MLSLSHRQVERIKKSEEYGRTTELYHISKNNLELVKELFSSAFILCSSLHNKLRQSKCRAQGSRRWGNFDNKLKTKRMPGNDQTKEQGPCPSMISINESMHAKQRNGSNTDETSLKIRNPQQKNQFKKLKTLQITVISKLSCNSNWEMGI